MSRKFHVPTTLLTTLVFAAVTGWQLEVSSAAWIGATGGSPGYAGNPTYHYLDAGNWSAGIDDNLDGLALTDDLTLYFDGPHTTNASGADWSPDPDDSNANDDFILTLDNDGTQRTVTLGGNVTVDFGGNSNDANSRVIVASGVTLDFNDSASAGTFSPTFSIGEQDSLTIAGSIINASNGFTLNSPTSSPGSLTLEADNSAGLTGGSIELEEGTLWIVDEDSLGADAVEVNIYNTGGQTRLDMTLLTHTGGDHVDVIGNDITVKTGTGNQLISNLDVELTGTLTIDPGTRLTFSNDKSVGQLTLSGDLIVGVGAETRLGNTTHVILTGDNSLLEGVMRSTANGGPIYQLGTALDQAYMTIDINDVGDPFGRFAGSVNRVLDLENAVLNFDTTDVTMSGSWEVVDPNLNTTYGALTTFELDGVAFTDMSGIWTASNGLGNWTYDESTGILELVLVAATPEPSAFVLMALALAGLICCRRRRRWPTK